MIKLIRDEEGIVFEYTPISGVDYIEELFENDKIVKISNTFFFSSKEQIQDYDEDNTDDYIYFRFATIEGDYYKVDGSMLGVDYDLYIFRQISVNRKHFVAQRNISIFKRIFKVIEDDIYLGGDKSYFTLAVLNELVKKFPNTYELNMYAMARIDYILNDYIDYNLNPRYSYESYMNKKVSKPKNNVEEIDINNNEIEKYEYLLKKLRSMLNNEISYSEKVWQHEILKVLLLLYPKYIRVFEEVPFKDVYSNKNRRLDFMLVDASGFVDIVEIKKPNDISIISKNVYRDNHVPLKELSGTIMQIEKYIFYLNKWGIKGEKKLNERYLDELPENLKLKIVNPNGIIIMGRSNTLNNEELADFEVIKRKYKNIVELMTYDDLVRRLENIVYKWKNFDEN